MNEVNKKIVSRTDNRLSLHPIPFPGCNKYCLDKNYGGIFIVWDRLFGTFQPELPDQEIVYGIVYQPSAFNPLYHQVSACGSGIESLFWCSDVSYLLGNIDTNINNHQTNIVNDADSTDVMKITMLREMITLLTIQNIIRLYIYI